MSISQTPFYKIINCLTFLIFRDGKIGKIKRIHNIKKMVKEIYGSEVGGKRKPWTSIQYIPLLGVVTRIKEMKTNRLLYEYKETKNV